MARLLLRFRILRLVSVIRHRLAIERTSQDKSKTRFEVFLIRQNFFARLTQGEPQRHRHGRVLADLCGLKRASPF